MKKLSLMALIIGAQFTAQSQCSQSTMNTDILYRGYNNEIDLKDCQDVANIHSDECTVEKRDGKFIVKTRSSKSAVLHLLSSSGDTINSKTYRCLNLPVPTLYFNGVASGGRSGINTSILEVKYDVGTPLKDTFKVTHWELQINGVMIEGSGFELNEDAKSVLNSSKNGEDLTIIATVIGTDGISRKIGGSWTLN